MSIISGFKPAVVRDTEAIGLPIDDMAKGLLARQNRADMAKNAFTLGDTALEIDTRNNQEDHEEAAKIRSEYHRDIDKMVDEVDGDWSKIDLSQIQAKAIDKTQDWRTKNLMDHRKEALLASAQQQSLMKTDGTYEAFGKDIQTSPLYDYIGGKPVAANATAWEIDKHLDYEAAAQDLYKDIGHSLIEVAGADSRLKDMQTWEMIKLWKSDKDNWKQIDAIINNAYDYYIKLPEGKQYKKVLERDYDKLGLPIKDRDKYVHDQIQNMITAVGNSKRIDEHKETADTNLQHIPQGSAGGSKSGSGDKVVPPPNILGPGSQPLTWHGASYDQYDNPIDAAYSLTDKRPMTEVPTNALAIKNTNQLTSFLLETGAVDKPINSGNDIQYEGGLFQLDSTTNDLSRSEPKKNRSVFNAFSPVNAAEKRPMSPAEELAYLQLDENEHVTISTADFMRGVKSVDPKNVEVAKAKFAAGNSMWSSMFSIKADTTSMDIVLDPYIVATAAELQKVVDAGPGEKMENKVAVELATLKLERLNAKIDQANAFASENAPAIISYEQHYMKLLDKQKSLEHEDQTFRRNAGLTSQHDEVLLAEYKKEKGPNATSQQAVDDRYNEFKKAKLTAWDNLLPGLENRNNTPIKLYTELEPYWENSTSDKTVGTSTKAAFGIGMSLLEDMKNGNLSLADIKETLGDITKYTNFTGTGAFHSYDVKAMSEAYARKKIEQADLFGDDERGGFQSAAIIPKIAQAVGSWGATLIDGGQNNLMAGHTEGKLSTFIPPTEMQKTYADAKSVELKSNKKLSGKTEWLKYFANIDESKMSYDREAVLYRLPEITQTQENGLTGTLINHVISLLGDDSTIAPPITQTTWNEYGGGKAIKREAFDVQAYREGQAKKENTAADFAGNLEKSMKILGMVQDPDNKSDHAFSLIVDLPGNTELAPRVRVEVPYTPDMSDLVLMGVPVMTARYSQDVKTGLAESGNNHFDLGDKDNQTLKRYWRAHVDLKEAGTGNLIKRGDIYMIGDGDPSIGGKGDYIRIGTTDEAIKNYIGQIMPNKNDQSQLAQLNAIWQHFESAKGNTKATDAIADFYFPNRKPGTSRMTQNDVLDQIKLLNGENPVSKVNKIVSNTTGDKLGDALNAINNPNKETIAGSIKMNNDGTHLYTPSNLLKPEETAKFDADLTLAKTQEEKALIKSQKSTLLNQRALALATAINPKIPKEMDQDPINGEWYPRVTKENNTSNEPETLRTVDVVNSYSSFSTNNDVRHEYGPEILAFLKEIDEQAKGGALDLGGNNARIVSGRRSLMQNMSAYKREMGSLTDSQHMYGRAIDIRTAEQPLVNGKSDNTHLGGLALLAYLRTPAGVASMKKAGVRLLYHKVNGSNMHIDIAVPRGREQAGDIIDKSESGDN